MGLIFLKNRKFLLNFNAASKLIGSLLVPFFQPKQMFLSGIILKFKPVFSIKF
jgi:hypothetical protein